MIESNPDKWVEVQHLIGDDWENVWRDENGNPQTFRTEAEAQAEIDELVNEMPDYDRTEYRIVPCVF